MALTRNRGSGFNTSDGLYNAEGVVTLDANGDPISPLAAGGNVAVASVAAGETHIGEVGSPIAYVASTPVLTVAATYVANDYVGTSTAPQAFAGAVRTAGGKGVVQSIVISDVNTAAAVAYELWLFSATFTAPADSAAWTVSDADNLLCVGVIPITTDRWFSSAAGKIYSDGSVGLVITCAATSLFYALVTRGAPTLASGDLTIKLGILEA